MKSNRTIVITLLGLVLLALLVWGFWPGPVLVESAVAVHAPLSVTVEEEGHTRVKDRFVISVPRLPATCNAVHWRSGTR